MQRGDAICGGILWTLGILFAVTGLAFLLVPTLVVELMNWTGGLAGHFEKLPAEQGRFWVSLSFAYMVLVTILALMPARDPVKYAHLIPILAAGKAATAGTGLAFYVFDRPAFLYMAEFLCDGSLCLLVLGCWAWQLRRKA